ncbi:MAG: hypothetical protein VKO44_04075 [Cyanobacteriota bacterium]|nr:hypothetical protein [Cyanobacteriota bacterium]
MMNRIFAPQTAIDLDPLVEGASDRPSPEPLGAGASPSPHQWPTGGEMKDAEAGRGTGTARSGPSLMLLVLAALAGMGLAGAFSSVVLMRQWTGLQRALSQERNLLLVERLRALGPATIAEPPADSLAFPPPPPLDSAPAPAPLPLADSEDAALPSTATTREASPPTRPPAATGPTLLRVPLSPRLTAAAPPLPPPPLPAPGLAKAKAAATPQRAGGRPGAAPQRAASGPLPQLVGLVGAPGRAGSAIFLVGETSTNVNVGEPIGASGWTLRAADADSALIERGTELRRIEIVAGG